MVNPLNVSNNPSINLITNESLNIATKLAQRIEVLTDFKRKSSNLFEKDRFQKEINKISELKADVSKGKYVQKTIDLNQQIKPYMKLDVCWIPSFSLTQREVESIAIKLQTPVLKILWNRSDGIEDEVNEIRETFQRLCNLPRTAAFDKLIEEGAQLTDLNKLKEWSEKARKNTPEYFLGLCKQFKDRVIASKQQEFKDNRTKFDKLQKVVSVIETNIYQKQMEILELHQAPITNKILRDKMPSILEEFAKLQDDKQKIMLRIEELQEKIEKDPILYQLSLIQELERSAQLLNKAKSALGTEAALASCKKAEKKLLNVI